MGYGDIGDMRDNGRLVDSINGGVGWSWNVSHPAVDGIFVTHAVGCCTLTKIPNEFVDCCTASIFDSFLFCYLSFSSFPFREFFSIPSHVKCKKKIVNNDLLQTHLHRFSRAFSSGYRGAGLADVPPP